MSTTPLRPRGPHLNALRAFEAAARHGSFSLASDELCVTPGAVAQHIKSLESWANAQLFDRYPHGVKLTRLGYKELPSFVKAFDGLGEAVQTLRSYAAPEQLSIAALPSVAQLLLSSRWLLTGSLHGPENLASGIAIGLRLRLPPH
jgi:LysR family glycine cleavage system transcriptional activator